MLQGKMAFKTGTPTHGQAAMQVQRSPTTGWALGPTLLVHLGSQVHVQAGRHCCSPSRRLKYVGVSRQRWPTWLKMSATEWMDSASMALLPDTQKVAILATKMAMLAEMAAETQSHCSGLAAHRRIEDASQLLRGHMRALHHCCRVIPPLGRRSATETLRPQAFAAQCSGIVSLWHSASAVSIP